MKKKRLFYGWWIVLAAFLNLFLSVGLIYYGFPAFYPSLIASLKFTRAQLTEGFFFGFVMAGLLLGLLAGALIDRVGPRQVIRFGVWLVGLPLLLMAGMTRLWQYYLLCFAEVAGYVLTGPIPQQVLISNWFQAKRGRAMGYAYLGLGLGGGVSPLLIHWLIEGLAWRRAFEVIGILILVILFPVNQWLVRSAPGELGLLPDGCTAEASKAANSPGENVDISRAVRSANFWLILAGCTLTIGAIGTVSQHLILFAMDQGYSAGTASRVLSCLVFSSLPGRLIVGYLADRYRKKNVMALFYLILALAIPLLFAARHPAALWGFAMIFGFAMGADYMLIPLVAAECFGLAALGKLLALIIMGYSMGQWLGPALAGRIFDATGSYDIAWVLIAAAGVLGAVIIYQISTERAR